MENASKQIVLVVQGERDVMKLWCGAYGLEWCASRWLSGSAVECLARGGNRAVH